MPMLLLTFCEVHTLYIPSSDEIAIFIGCPCFDKALLILLDLRKVFLDFLNKNIIRTAGKVVTIVTIKPTYICSGVIVRNRKLRPLLVDFSGATPYHIASTNIAKNNKANAVEVLCSLVYLDL